jgi:predicted phosphodiesterase
MDSLENDSNIKIIIVCTHHSPYTNSSVVSPSKDVTNYFVPKFIQNTKAKLFISGHSHNLEYFNIEGKYFIVIGGGGLKQNLRTDKKQRYNDLIKQEDKLRFFYLSVTRQEQQLLLEIYGFLDGNELNNVQCLMIND